MVKLLAHLVKTWSIVVRTLAVCVAIVLVIALIVAGQFLVARSLELFIMVGMIITAVAVTWIVPADRAAALQLAFFAAATWGLSRVTYYLWLVITKP